MLPELSAPAWSEIDVEVFDRLVKPDHYVRRALELMDFERFRPILAPYYSPDQGRPAEEPVRMLKLEFLQYYDTLSDRQVVDRGQTDMAYRYFLGLGLDDELPHPSSLCVFRGRIGVEGHRAIFNELIAQAREHGLVRDRLRLKDATHVIADVAIPSTLALIAQVRNKLLGAVEPFDALRAEGERARAEMIRTSTDGRPNEERLAARVTHLREILAWVDELASPADGEESRVWQTLVATRGLAHKILADQDPAQKGDRTRSTVDPDARCGKHGSWYDGYLLDVMMDADSELITAVEMLPANGNEAADAAELVRQEEQAQGNDVEALSIDGVGFRVRCSASWKTLKGWIWTSTCRRRRSPPRAGQPRCSRRPISSRIPNGAWSLARRAIPRFTGPDPTNTPGSTALMASSARRARCWIVASTSRRTVWDVLDAPSARTTTKPNTFGRAKKPTRPSTRRCVPNTRRSNESCPSWCVAMESAGRVTAGGGKS